jgi:hypothetical protein
MNRHVLALLLRPGSGQRSLIALPLIAFGVVTALVLTVIGGAQSFWTWTGEMAPIYQALAAIALVLLVVPLLSLGGAAARLSARRRDERLSTLRLLGVSPAGVTVATVIESVLLAGAGAVAGVLAYLAASPLIALIPFRGEALGLAGVLLPPAQVVMVVLGVLALAAVSAVIGLRKVVISPLGVRTRSTVSTVHWIRAVIAVGVLLIAYALISVFPSVASFVTTIVVLAGLFAAAIAVLNLIGPWILRVTATGQLRRAERPDRLLAARIVLDAPKAAWRQIGGIAMASFIAVFAGTGVSLMNVMGAAEAEAELAADMRTGLIITLIGSFLMVAASVGVNQASDVLDQRELHRSLHHLGMPLETVDRARRRAIMSPLLITAIGSAVCAGVLVFPLMGLALITAPASLLTIVAVVTAGIGIVWLTTRATRPLLARSFAPV